MEESMNPLLCKHTRFEIASMGEERPLSELRGLIAQGQCRAAMRLYKTLTPEERETIQCQEFEPSVFGSEIVYVCIFYANPDAPKDCLGIWKEGLDKVAAGKSPIYDENGEPR